MQIRYGRGICGDGVMNRGCYILVTQQVSSGELLFVIIQDSKSPQHTTPMVIRFCNASPLAVVHFDFAKYLCLG